MEGTINLENVKEEDTFGEEQLTLIFETYHKKVYNYIYYRIGQRASAEDLTSQVFEKVIRGRASYSKLKSPFEVWLFAIAKNCISNYFRDQKKHSWSPLETVLEMISSKKSPEDLAVEGETNSKLYKSLNILKERERNIVALKFGAGLSNVEIGEIMSLSESNVGSILYRTMKKLKKEMEKEDVICLKKA